MSKTKVDRMHVDNVLNDAIADATSRLCAEYGIEMIEWYYPFDDDAESAFAEFSDAVSNAIEQTISWYADDEE